ncbi:MAG: hypothetical protein KF752_10825 [Pirellulaceae bacterium]|nr:hypothetical protein [Pirellulaceae bacterium]
MNRAALIVFSIYVALSGRLSSADQIMSAGASTGMPVSRLPLAVPDLAVPDLTVIPTISGTTNTVRSSAADCVAAQVSPICPALGSGQRCMTCGTADGTTTTSTYGVLVCMGLLVLWTSWQNKSKHRIARAKAALDSTESDV